MNQIGRWIIDQIVVTGNIFVDLILVAFIYLIIVNPIVYKKNPFRGIIGRLTYWLTAIVFTYLICLILKLLLNVFMWFKDLII